MQRLPAGITIVQATGDLNSETSSQMYLVVANELLQEPTQLVLKFSDLMSVDKSAADTLVSLSALAAESDISFCLVAPDAGPVVTTLEQAGLIERFEIFPTVSAATGSR